MATKAVSWADLTPISQSNGQLQQTGQQPVSWSDATPVNGAADPQYGFSQNVDAGLINPAVSMANLGGEGMQYVDQKLLDLHHHLFGGAPKTQASQTIPQIPHNDNWKYLLGNVAGLAFPFTEAEKAAGAAIEGAKALAPFLERIPQLAQDIGRTGAASSATAYGTTPGSAQKRESSALLGAGLGALGPVAGRLLKLPASVLKRVSKNVVANAVKPLHKYINKSLNARLGGIIPENTIGKAYKYAKREASWKKNEPLVQSADESISTPLVRDPKPVPAGIQKEWKIAKFRVKAMGMGGGTIDSNELLLKNVYKKAREKYGLSPEDFIKKDTTEPLGYDATSYKKEALNILEEARKVEKVAPKTYEGLTDMVKVKVDNVPTSFSEALDQKKDINKMASSWDKITNDVKVHKTRYYAGKLGRALDANVEEQTKTPEAENFLKEWRTQRQNHARLQEFYVNPQASGNARDFDPALKQDLERGNYKAVVQRYIPTKNQEMHKIAQFRGLVGNPELADKTILSQALQPYRTSPDEINALKLGQGMHQGKVSDSIHRLLTPDEETGLGNIMHADDIATQVKNSPGLLKQLGSHSIFAGIAAGTAAHHLFGLPWEYTPLAYISGAMAPKNLSYALGNHYERKAQAILDKGDISKLKELVEPLEGHEGRRVWKNYIRQGLYGGALSPITYPSSSKAEGAQ